MQAQRLWEWGVELRLEDRCSVERQRPVRRVQQALPDPHVQSDPEKFQLRATS